MATEDNVVKLPDLLERHAQKIEAALDRQDDANERTEKANKDWKEATLEIAIELAAAKKELRSLQAFGKWCAARFGDNRLPKDDLAALTRWGSDPEETRTMLAKDDSRSVQMIDRRFRNVTKTPTTPKREEAEASIRVHKSVHGVYPTVLQAGKETGLSRIVIEPALAAVKAEDRVAPMELALHQSSGIPCRSAT